MDQLVATLVRLQGMERPRRYVLRQSKTINERMLMSPGAAWIIRRILAGEARPRPDSAISAVVPLAWKNRNKLWLS